MVNEMDKKRILFVITKSVWGGAQKYVYDLAVNLPEDEFEVLVAAGGNGIFADKIKEVGIDYYEIKNFQRDVSFVSDILAFFEVLRILFKFRPDVVHTNSSKAGGIVGISVLVFKLLTFDLKFLTVFTVHGWAFNEARPKWQIFLIRQASRLTCIFYDKIICVSEYDKRAAIKNKIATERKLVAIHNGIDIDEEVFLEREEARKKIFNFQFSIFNEFSMSKFSNSKTIIVGTVGEFTKNKGQEYLIEAAKKFSIFNFQFSMFIIGWGEKKSNLKSQISNLKLDDKVFLVEGLSPAMPYLRAFDIFVLPSLKEGLPYTLLEAGLVGLPVIASNVGGIPEIIENEKTGLLVSPADVNALANAIQKLAEDKNLAEKLAENLRQKIISEFSLGKMLEKTLNVYSTRPLKH